MAEWKEIAGYEGLYLVSNAGEVIALPKIVKCGRKTIHRKGKPIKIQLRGRKGHEYQSVRLTDGVKQKTYSIHRLVAEAFLPNPDRLPEVNHKDENRLNNRVENLEWCTRQYNMEYSKNKPIVQIDDDGYCSIYGSATIASKMTGIGRTSINNALCKRSLSAGGYQWRYCEEV